MAALLEDLVAVDLVVVVVDLVVVVVGLGVAPDSYLDNKLLF